MSNGDPLTFLGPEDGLNCRHDWECAFLDVHYVSDVGKKRKNNEDSCLLCAPEDPHLLEKRGVLFAVADGMGGASAGEHASRMALENLGRRYYSDNTKGLVPAAMRIAIEGANDMVFNEAERVAEYSGMGTTVSALAVMGNWAYMAQVGDSRIYLHRPEFGLKQLTEDHSLVAEQIRSGLINEDEARNHMLKNLITRAVGIKETVEVDLFALEILPGDTLLLCSDGLSNMVGDFDLGLLMAEPDLKAATGTLVEKALEAGGTDNITVVTLRVTAAPQPTYYQQGAQRVALVPEGFFARLKRRFLS